MPLFNSTKRVTANFWLNLSVVVLVMGWFPRIEEFPQLILPTWLVCAIVFAHFVADFRLQSHWMSINKSKRWSALLAHVAAYTATILVLMALATYPRVPLWSVAFWALLNGAIHLCVDALTSQATSTLWFFEPFYDGETTRRNVWVSNGTHPHWFFEMIGFDQLLHYASLLVTASWWLV